MDAGAPPPHGRIVRGVDLDALTPPQRRVVEELFDRGGRHRRPEFDPGLPVRLRDQLEDGLAAVAEDLAPRELRVNKRDLANVLACERHHVAEAETGFGGWTPATARGTVAHKALELRMAMAVTLAPLELVDAAIDRLEAADRPAGLGAWLADLNPVERAELRAGANEIVAKFEECWPPLQAAWRPRTEVAEYLRICDDRITLAAKVDLALGQARGREARVLIVDLKTGHPQPGHLDDLRYYALVHAIRTGVPPFRVASYYLDACSFHHEDIDEDLLRQAAARVVEGVTRIVELRHTRIREPGISPGPRCGWCLVRDDCDGAAAWQAQQAEDRPDAGMDATEF